MFNYKSRYLYEDLDEIPRSKSPSKFFGILLGTGTLAVTCIITVCIIVVSLKNPTIDQSIVKLQATEGQEQEPVLLEIDQGKLEGKRLVTRGGREYLAFLGIPYATPPVGALRFKPPVEAESWNGTLNATEFRSVCIQGDSHRNGDDGQVKGSEDCLHLNVYTPMTIEELNANSSQRRRGRGRNKNLPVLLYIHGGIGGAFGHVVRYGADYLLDEDIVWVTHHYRLGVLGNLFTNDSNSSGNFGLKDTAMALKWLQKNIEAFGGDKDNILLFGESYGAMSVSAHLLSPRSKGLFHKAILQSGTMLFPGAIQQNPIQNAFILGDKLNCTRNNTQELIDCLREVDAKEIALKGLEEPLDALTFTMAIESAPEIVDEAFLPDSPLNLLQDVGKINAMPVISGVTSAELLFQSLAILLSPNTISTANTNWNKLIIPLLKLDIPAKDQSSVEQLSTKIHDFYFGNQNISRETERNLTNLFSDRSYVHPASVCAEFQLKANKDQSNSNGNRRRKRTNSAHNVYLYHFSKKVEVSYFNSFAELYGSDYYLGSSHADDLQFIFPYEPFPFIPLEDKNANFSKMMVQLWTSFAKNGKPESTYSDLEWTPITEEKPYSWFQLDDTTKMLTELLATRMTFWDSLNLTDIYV